MAVFKGEATVRAPAGDERPLQVDAMKLVRANPRFIRRSGELGASTRDGTGPDVSAWEMNEWDLVTDPTDPRFLCYRVLLFREAKLVKGRFVPIEVWAVVVSLNINDSLRRVFPTLAKATVAFDSIQPMTTVKTLVARGFRRY